MAHEVAETLARRVRLSILTHPVLIAVTILTIPGASRRLAFNLPWGVLILMITEIRYRTTAAFDQLYPADPRRWYRMFRAGALASVIAWDAFAIHEMNAGGDGWPTWIMLLMTAGIGAGATTSLRPGPPLLRWFLVSLLTPQIVWGLHRGGADGVAIVLVSSAFLTLIQIQGNHNASVFWRSTRDKEALRAARQRLESLVNSIDGVVWESDLQRSRFNFVSRQAEAILGYAVDSWHTEPKFWRDHLYPPDRDAAVRLADAECSAGGDHTLEFRERFIPPPLWLLTRGGAVEAHQPGVCSGSHAGIGRHHQRLHEPRRLAGLLWNRDKAGREFPFSLSTALVQDEQDRTIATTGVGSDCSDRKRSEDELLRAKAAAESANQCSGHSNGPPSSW